MGTNQVGRGRSVGVGQQELQLRLPKRSAGSNETRVVFQRGTPDLTQMQRQAMSTSPKIQAAQQGLASRVGAAMSPNTQAVATGEIKNPSLSALVPQKATWLPCCAKARTSSAPMPEEPPEMKTVRPRRDE